MSPIVDLIAGALLLVVGRKLFWLFVAIAGFYFGIEIAKTLAAEQPAWLVWALAIGAGVVGAVLAIFMQRLGFALAGFYAGGYLALVAVQRFAPGSFEVAAFVIGGVIAAILAAALMDWAIVVVSSLVGAALIVSVLGLQPLWSSLAYVALVVVGVVVQSRLMPPAAPPTPSSR
ncbi:MAG: DUF4203 domain-containing protein [Burkholderiales bacterium]|jgi:hypothetical protein|nr:DUF4203 domain-containing protein [Burkholderiales bacterium]